MSKPIFPINGMPRFLYDFSADLADVYGVPIEFATMPLISAFATAVGKKAKLTTSKYTNYAQFWIVIVGNSSTGKSEPLKIAYKPIREFEKKEFENFQNPIIVRNTEKAKAKGENQPLPKQNRITCTDTTPEALFSMLANNPSMTLLRDELSGHFKDIGRYNQSGEVGHWLSCFDNTTFRIDRKNNECSILVSEPILSMIGTVQPEVLKKIAKGHDMKENGYLQRCLFVYPDEVLRSHYNDKSLNPNLVEMYDKSINYLLNWSGTADFTLSEESNKMYIDFSNEITDMVNATPHNYLKSLYGKMEIHLLRLALILSIIDVENNDYHDCTVSAEVMRYAIDLCRYFILTGEKMFGITNPQLPSKEEAIRTIRALYPDINQSTFARSIGVSREYVNKVLRE